MNELSVNFSINHLFQWVEDITGCLVNFEDLSGITLEIPSLRCDARFLHHHGRYCETVKLAGLQSECSRYKTRFLRDALKEKTCESLCPRGIWDAVQPVRFENAILGVFFVGGLHKADRLKPIRGLKNKDTDASQRYSPNRAATAKRYATFLSETVLLIVAKWTETGRRIGERKPEAYYANAVKQYVLANYHQNVSLVDFARTLGLSPKYLGPLIKRAAGETFREILIRTRIEKAKVLLVAKKLSITEIAFECGFNDSNYFSVTFRDIVGSTPSEFCLS
ncbi:MAG: AraC family transcriptional regulator [Planctomycetota bacterium]